MKDRGEEPDTQMRNQTRKCTPKVQMALLLVVGIHTLFKTQSTYTKQHVFWARSSPGQGVLRNSCLQIPPKMTPANNSHDPQPALLFGCRKEGRANAAKKQAWKSKDASGQISKVHLASFDLPCLLSFLLYGSSDGTPLFVDAGVSPCRCAGDESRWIFLWRNPW